MKLLTYPFAAIVGQEKMKQALILNIINPGLSGVLIRGEKGTAKSTAVRALAEILPMIEVIEENAFQLDPQQDYEEYCTLCRALGRAVEEQEDLVTTRRRVRVVELPVGATEDRLVGTLDLEHALKEGEKRVEPGLLARAHRNILYVDEVNLLDDHLVDVLLDSAAMGVNTIEREGISFSHPARFTLVGTMNPEEGELRPQLLDRFGLCVNVGGINSIDERVQIMERRMAFDTDREAFVKKWQRESTELADTIIAARALLPQVSIAHALLEEVARNCIEVGVDGHRGDIIMLKTAKTLAALYGRKMVMAEDIREAAELVLPHRIRRQPLMDIPDTVHQYRAGRGK
ncbi:ATP-binding protein [Desulforhopalus vacuolatus]|uniref:ATP-binding protein n=1 Tax=Desulforhopalus vacuolatus TaxID=40414 RepID=UPI0019651628|nr:ATP-binding protein [Desulforhopalus vacuolatus]MBM9520794.1 ATP-binding protein [Desulforhopalus vacuolatus]